MKKPTKEQIVADLKDDLKRKKTAEIYPGDENVSYSRR
jgi:hypothetical protein